MKRWWIADIHSCHDNILEYEPGRKSKDAAHWLHKIVNNCNSRIRTEDTVVHVGDFISKGNVRGVPSLPFRFDEVRRLFNGHWVFVEGNHDENNGVRTCCKYMFCDVGPYKAFVTHVPLDNPYRVEPVPPALIDAVKILCDFVICGHVHHHWQYTVGCGMVHVNVGVDAWRCQPIEDAELIEFVKPLITKRHEVERIMAEMEKKQ